MQLFEPAGYGRFDPATFGMWLNIDRALVHPDFARFGTLMWSTFHFPLDEDHRRYVRNAPSQEDAIFAATCFTVATHERRHFHDLLATPYGSMLARQYLRAAFFYGLLVDDVLFRRNRIAVPLDDWCQNAELFRDAYGIDLPTKSIVDINSIFKTMLDKLAEFDRGQLNTNRSSEIPTASTILEGIAVMVQLREIGEEFGLGHGEAFGRSVLESSAASRYFGALKIIPSVLGIQLPIAAEALLLHASLYGDFQDPDPARLRSPTDLFLGLLTWMEKKNVFRRGGLRSSQLLAYVIDAINEYFEREQGGSLKSRVAQATATNRRAWSALRRDLTQIEESTGRQNTNCRCVLEVFRNFMEVQAAFSEKVCDNLGWYVTYDYVRERFFCPQPLTYIESAIGVPVDNGFGRLYFIQSEDHIFLQPETRVEMLADPALPEALKRAIETAQTVADFKREMVEDLHSITKVAPGYQDTIYQLSPDTRVIRNAYVMSPRKRQIPGNSQMPDIDTTLWQQYYDQTSPIRLFLEGPDRGMSKAAVRDTLVAFGAFHTEVFTTAGRLAASSPDPDGTPDLVSGALSALREIKRG